jgi:hypothetical protein
MNREINRTSSVIEELNCLDFVISELEEAMEVYLDIIEEKTNE